MTTATETVAVSAPGAPAPARRNFMPGAILALVLLVLYGGLALSVDFPRAAIGIQSDEATYYMMGYSLALDGDLTYRREDLMRVWREFPSGPTGVFLKKGQDITDWGFMRRPPFFWTSTVPDADQSRYFYGKSFIYAAFAAPFVRAFGTNGFLVFHSLLLALVAWCSYVFLHARMRPAVAVTMASAFLLVSVVPVYFVWITPELFNFAFGLLAYFCWLYKYVASPVESPRGMRWLFKGSSDMLASVLLGIVTFSKITNALLFPPLVLWQIWRRQWRRAIVSSIAFAVVTLGLYGANMAISGEWNYQGGEDRASLLQRVSAADARVDIRGWRHEGTQRGADRDHLRPARVRDESVAQRRLLLRRPLYGHAGVLLSGLLRPRRLSRDRAAPSSPGNTSSSRRFSARCSSLSSARRIPGTAAADRSAIATS